jgi:hypothetical protein
MFTIAACGNPPPKAPAAPAACPTAAIRIHAQRELDALRGCATLPGLELRGAVPFDLAPLDALVTIEGDLAVRSTFALGSVRLPALTRVSGAITIISNLNLAGVYLPALASAGSLTVTDAPPLMQIMLPALTQLDGDLTFARLPSLELVDLSTLPSVGGSFTVEGANRLETWLGPTDVTRTKDVH